MKPTAETYNELQLAYDTFNAKLFDGLLPECLITLQRENRTYGYFSSERFANRHGAKTDEIALNPSYFAVVPLIETMQTLAHEMAHLWQFHLGTPGRGRYHNTEWADKMEAIGLMPSSTGKPGGKRTGDCMADYPIEGGRFIEVCSQLLTQDFRISWYDRFAPASAVQAGQNSYGLTMDLPAGAASVAAFEGVEMATSIDILADPTGITGAPAANKSNRSKYTCSCGTSVWGKPGLNIVCGECEEPFGELL